MRADPPAPARPLQFNARGETVEEKPVFGRCLASRRCLVLADGFYEWAQVCGEQGCMRTGCHMLAA